MAVALVTMLAAPAKADRPVTTAEREKLVAAISAQGCNGGKMEWDDDDREFEIDDVRCGDGRRYDLTFDAQFVLKTKKLDD
jgi:hypothetical protein